MYLVAKTTRAEFRLYFIALAAVLLATGIVLSLPPLVERGALVVYLGTIALVTWFCGWRPGLLAIGLCALAIAWFVLPPMNSLVLTSWDDVMRLCVFLLVALVVTALHASRERARREVWYTEERLAFALRCAGMGAWYSDLKTGRFWWSQGMEEMFGRPPGEFSGTYDAFIAYIHPDDQDFVRRAITHTIEGGKEFQIEHRITRPDGTARRIATRGRIVQDDLGQSVMIIGVASDVTGNTAGEQAASTPVHRTEV